MLGLLKKKQTMTAQGASGSEIQWTARSFRAAVLLFAGIAVLLIGAVLSVSIGAADIHLRTVWNALFHFQPQNTSHQIIRDLRLPRTAAAALVGAFLAVSGAIMQGLTRNPLAEPSIMGVTSGSGFAIACAFAFFRGCLQRGLSYGPLRERVSGRLLFLASACFQKAD